MSALLSGFLSFILLYKYWAIFLIICSASFILPLPANAILVALGAFASQGYLSLWGVLITAIMTNIGTDCFAYFLTHRYGKSVLDRLLIRLDGKLAVLEKNLRTYAFGTIFLTRIAGPFAPYVNFLSGLIGVPFSKFLLADVIGNAPSISFFVLSGYILGNHWQDFLANISLIGGIVIGCFGLYLIYVFFWKGRRML